MQEKEPPAQVQATISRKRKAEETWSRKKQEEKSKEQGITSVKKKDEEKI